MALNSDLATDEDFKENLAKAFSSYRAEGLGAEVFGLFTKPSYFPQLTTSPHPCFLVGGRGTGKTTVLKCLSYQGQAALSHGGDPGCGAGDWRFVGMYHRVNTNRVRAFRGPELEDDKWLKLFAHYMNLELSELALRFLQWYAVRYPDATRIGGRALHSFAATFDLTEVGDLGSTLQELYLSRLRFEAAINNVGDSKIPNLSMQGAPIDVLLGEVKALPQFTNTFFFYLLDEYENFDDGQQKVVNTLIKHSGEQYSFKVGVREFGFKQRSTLSEHEKLMHPADYKLIDITKELHTRFPEFAAEVCGRRLSATFAVPEVKSLDLMRDLFGDISAEEEAELLGVKDVLRAMVQDLREGTAITGDEEKWLRSVDELESYTLLLRAEAEKVTPAEKLRSAVMDLSKWKEQYGNYKYAYLFTIRKGKRGIRKHYCGWTVYCQLAASNIRFLLELVDQAFTLHAERAQDLSAVESEVQTRAAQITGQKKLRELEGVSLNGAKLSRFLLGLGRVFQVMSENPVGHTPEVNQFCLSVDVEKDERREEVESLLKEGIMHLALLWYPGSKLQERTDVRQFDYAIHPMFAPFFGFSHRRKRKIHISDEEFEILVSEPREAIARLLRDQRRVVDDELPEQLGLFSELYGLRHDR